jgi:hypothetical protein
MVCTKCGKDTCSCQIKDGLCKACRKAVQNEKIQLTINIPKEENSEIRS